MKLRLAVVVLCALVLVFAPRAAYAQSAALVVGAGERVSGDLATISRPISVAGVVEGDVTSWSGAIEITGTVLGDVVSYAGTVALGPGADVRGNVLALGGAVTREGAQVAGQVLGSEPIAGGRLVSSVFAIFQPERAAGELPRPLVSGTLALAALLLMVASAAIWPLRTQGLSIALRHAPRAAASLGVLSTLLLGALTIVLTVVLALSLIGLPLILPALVLVQAPFLVGLTGLARLLGERIGGSSWPSAALVALGGAVILIPLALLGISAPIWSTALFYALAGVGLGAAILSRGGAYQVQ
jgi:cytoskeletal protein CcmA (bactofilin family)